MDDCDLGSRHAERFLKIALDRQRNRQAAGASGIECSDCGEEIPEARRRAAPGCTRCVDCQEAFERGTP